MQMDANPYRHSEIEVSQSLIQKSVKAVTFTRLLTHAVVFGLGLWAGIYFGYEYAFRDIGATRDDYFKWRNRIIEAEVRSPSRSAAP